jgi:mono/diheme cytochrome c family protein
VLGFSPIQIARRSGELATASIGTGEDETSQAERLSEYGVLAGFDTAVRPQLEKLGGNLAPRNSYELEAQAYLLGNCAHCHNPNGFAVKQEAKLRAIDFSAGRLFQFALALRGVSSGQLLVTAGSPESSEIYNRISKATQLQGTVALQHMPLHTPATDCRAVEVIGRWIAGIPVYPSANPTPEQRTRADDDAKTRAEKFSPSCKPAPDISFVEEDFSEPASYEPRRQDWADTVNGMPAHFRSLSFDDELRTLASTKIANGYFNNKRDICDFPSTDSPQGGVRPWMTSDGKPSGTPKRPYGQVFYQTPGAAYFAEACQKCHGPEADGASGIAKLLAAQTGGSVRVANLKAGLFGNNGERIKLFDVDERNGKRNLAGNYVIWMASGGTRVTFPAGFSDLVGPFGSNMLNRIREQFKKLLPNAKGGLSPTYYSYDIYNSVATLQNPIPIAAAFDSDGFRPADPATQDAWLDRAQTNAGFMLYRFLSEDIAKGEPRVGPNDCERVYPKQ